MPGAPEPSTHVVVFDVNVWLDVAAMFGPGRFSWAALTKRLAVEKVRPCPAPGMRELDSARALAVCTSGKFTGSHSPLQVWTSSHIDDVLVHKLTQPTEADDDEGRGYGWSTEDADDFLHDCVYELVWGLTGGSTVGDVLIPHGNPPLDHEDGLVHRTALEAGDDPVVRYLVTQDRTFRTASLLGDVTKLYSHEWVHLVERSRAVVGMARIRPPI